MVPKQSTSFIMARRSFRDLTDLTSPLPPVVFLVSVAIYYSWGLLMRDFDTPWHLAAGDFMRQHLLVPRIDPFSYTAPGARWFNVSWGWDVCVSWIAAQLGLKALFIVMVLMYASISVLVYGNQVRRGIKPSAAAFTTLLVSLNLSSFFCGRPYAVSFLMAALFYRLLSRKCPCRALFALPLLMMLWCNMHGGFLYGFAIMLAFIAEALLHKDRRRIAMLMSSTGLCGLTSLINPDGIDIYYGIYRHLSNPISKHVPEFLPLYTTFPGRADYGAFESALPYLCFFCLVSCWKRPRSLSLADTVLSVAFLISALAMSRNVPLFAILSAPYAAFKLQSLNDVRDWSRFDRPDHAGSALACCIGGFGALILAVYANFPKINVIDFPRMPVVAIRIAHECYPDVKFLNSYEIGGYFLYSSHGVHRVFFDTRLAAVHPYSVYVDYMMALQIASARNKIFKAYDIGGVILMKPNPLAQALDQPGSNFTKAYEDEKGILFIKSSLIDSGGRNPSQSSIGWESSSNCAQPESRTRRADRNAD